MAKIKIVDTDVMPICPHCNKELDTIALIAKGVIQQTMIYICPHCKKIISIGYNRGA